MRRHAGLLLIALSLAACDKQLHGLFEGPPPPEGRLALALQTSAVSVPQGGTQTVSATVTRIGDVPGKLGLTVQDVPPGVDVAIDTTVKTDSVTGVTLTIRVLLDAPVGDYSLRVHGHADPSSDISALLVLSITAAPSYTVSLSKPAVTIVRGGIARLSATTVRTNFTDPVTLALDASLGIGATFATAAADRSDITISVAPDAAPGPRTLTIHGTAPGLADRTATIALTVSVDPIQVIAEAALAVGQGSSVASDLIVNHPASTSPVTLSADNLPPGVTATFEPVSPTGNASSMTLSVSADVPAGSYSISVRATSDGVAAATADVVLNVSAVGIALSLAPQAVTLLPGASATVGVALTRIAYTGTVTLAADSAPVGVTITPQPASVSGSSATLAVAASSAAVPGQYNVTIRATPDRLGGAGIRVATLSVTIRPASSGDGNVVLDWSHCAPPAWIAAQDGSSPWTQALPIDGIVRFTVSAGKGGFAYADAGSTVVRFMTQDELTAQPIDLCPAHTKTVSGVGANLGASGWNYHLGGGTGSSTSTQPNFIIVGVAGGVHDLIVWSQASRTFRGLIQRDVDIPDGGSLGTVDLAGESAFVPNTANVLFSGSTSAGDRLFLNMNYLTTAACTADRLYDIPATGVFSGGTASFSAQFAGVPDAAQRPTDFHLATVMLSSPSSTRSAGVAFHTLADRAVALPPLVDAPAVTALAGTFKRLQATATIPPEYDRSATLQYADAVQVMSVSATAGYSGGSSVVLAMPDLSGVSGWSTRFGVAPTATGTWAFSLDGGATGTAMCSEGARTVAARLSGVF